MGNKQYEGSEIFDLRMFLTCTRFYKFELLSKVVNIEINQNLHFLVPHVDLTSWQEFWQLNLMKCSLPFHEHFLASSGCKTTWTKLKIVVCHSNCSLPIPSKARIDLKSYQQLPAHKQFKPALFAVIMSSTSLTSWSTSSRFGWRAL